MRRMRRRKSFAARLFVRITAFVAVNNKRQNSSKTLNIDPFFQGLRNFLSKVGQHKSHPLINQVILQSTKCCVQLAAYSLDRHFLFLCLPSSLLGSLPVWPARCQRTLIVLWARLQRDFNSDMKAATVHTTMITTTMKMTAIQRPAGNLFRFLWLTEKRDLHESTTTVQFGGQPHHGR